MNTKRLATALIAVIMMAGKPVQATVLFSDNFASTQSGSGFIKHWSCGSISGGKITLNHEKSFRTLATPIDTKRMDFWLVSQITMGKKATQWGGLSMFANADNEDLFIGASTQASHWELKTDGMLRYKKSKIRAFTGTETLLMVHITSTAIDMWINPSDISSAAALGTADASWSGKKVTPNAKWKRVRLATSDKITINSIRAATRFSEATAKLSPGATQATAKVAGPAALLGLGEISLILRDRKK